MIQKTTSPGGANPPGFSSIRWCMTLAQCGCCSSCSVQTGLHLAPTIHFLWAKIDLVR